MNSIKKVVNYLGIYISGVVISSSFILFTNDIFYNIVIRQFKNGGNKSEIWKEIKPREIVARGPKYVFIKNQITEDKEDEQRRYRQYVEQRKYEDLEGLSPNEKVYENIFDNNKAKKL